jgi:hypothetical protein
MELIVIVVKGVRSPSGVASVRPDFGPKQVRLMSEIIEGKHYVFHDRVRSRDVTFIGEPFIKNGNWWIKSAYAFGAEVDLDEDALNDMGVVAYPGGNWNKTNWLERTY